MEWSQLKLIVVSPTSTIILIPLEVGITSVFIRIACLFIIISGSSSKILTARLSSIGVCARRVYILLAYLVDFSERILKSFRKEFWEEVVSILSFLSEVEFTFISIFTKRSPSVFWVIIIIYCNGENNLWPNGSNFKSLNILNP